MGVSYNGDPNEKLKKRTNEDAKFLQQEFSSSSDEEDEIFP
jgi:hypothetical protein